VDEMKNNAVPLHKQITEWLQEQIETGVFKANEKLPSENDLSEQFEVSRVTVRRALQTLENEKVIYRCQGVGSFVNDNRAHNPLMELKDFMEEVTNSGFSAESRVVSYEQKHADKEIADMLNIKEEAMIVEIDRVRLGDGEPIAYDQTWMPVFYGQLIDGHDLQKRSIYQILESEYEIPVLKGCYRIEAVNATPEQATHLNLQENDALMKITRITFTIGDKPIYYQRRYLRSDKLVYEFQVHRDQEASQNEIIDVSASVLARS
tara:strand:+ start:51090 stop:51878 length:789 start_codon:yes stop_codon:yes gene_type:complete